ncbi:MAG: SWIM zinc finger family protein [Candidatus Bathyarchaeia archaeon]
MPLEVMIDKAMRLIKAGRVERLDDRRYNVIGDHGTYTVVQTREGRVSCNCPGFLSRRRCSHSAAVVIMTEFSGRRVGP